MAAALFTIVFKQYSGVTRGRAEGAAGEVVQNSLDYRKHEFDKV